MRDPPQHLIGIGGGEAGAAAPAQDRGGNWQASDAPVLEAFRPQDGFRCCYADPSKPRPTKFETKPDSGLTLYALERVKEK